MSNPVERETGILLDNDLERVKPTIVYRLFNPQVPVIICSKSKKDVAAMPANSCSPVSDSPPLISIALKKGIRTNKIIRSSLLFSINWVNFNPESSRRIILDLAKTSESEKRSSDKLMENKIPYVIVKGAPVLKRACAFAICRVQKRLTTGDHDLFIGRVSIARAIQDFTKDEYWRFEDYKPVLYIGSIRPYPLMTISK
jgi:flavin reductase (DIM6/NTAB) family NADH-FMN oxidoreductase RutF